VRFDLARGAAVFAYIRIPQRRRAAASSWWIVHRQTRWRGWRTIPTCCPTRLSRDRGGQAVLSSRRTVDAAPSLVSTACDGIAVSAAASWCTTAIASRNLYSVDAAVLTDFTQSRRRRGRDDQEPGRQGRSGWLGSDAQGRVYLTTGSSTHPAFDPSQGTADTFNRRLRRCSQPAFGLAGFAGVGEGGTLYNYLDAGESFASFQRGGRICGSRVLSVQGTDGRDARGRGEGGRQKAEGIHHRGTEGTDAGREEGRTRQAEEDESWNVWCESSLTLESRK